MTRTPASIKPMQRMGGAIRDRGRARRCCRGRPPARCRAATSSSSSLGSSIERTPWPMRVTGRSRIAAHTLSGPATSPAWTVQPIALVVRQPVGRREVGRRELGLVAAHAEAHDIGMRLGHDLLRQGQRPVGPEMADADRDDAAHDAELALAPGRCRSTSAPSQCGVGDAQRLGPLGRAEHLDIDRALARRRAADRNRSRRRNRAACAAPCRPGRRRRGSSGNRVQA